MLSKGMRRKAIKVCDIRISLFMVLWQLPNLHIITQFTYYIITYYYILHYYTLYLQLPNLHITLLKIHLYLWFYGNYPINIVTLLKILYNFFFGFYSSC